MHQTRSEVTKKLPIPRKGTKYVARPLSDIKNSVTIVAAVRDMLHLARTAREVQEMIKQKLLKINGRIVKDYRDSIRLFNILEAGNNYVLALTRNGRFTLEEAKNPSERLCKVINKKILKKQKVQINLHDNSNIIADNKIQIGDSLYLDLSGKIKRTVQMKEGKDCIIISGKYIGFTGRINSVVNNKVEIKLKEKDALVELEKRSIVTI
ncbi:MAG: S4 domain-containing protein [Nanoarchaeota archaeon]